MSAHSSRGPLQFGQQRIELLVAHEALHPLVIDEQHWRVTAGPEAFALDQRHLAIGYNKAANLLEAMEKAGLVSAMNGRGQREILVPGRGE